MATCRQLFETSFISSDVIAEAKYDQESGCYTHTDANLQLALNAAFDGFKLGWVMACGVVDTAVPSRVIGGIHSLEKASAQTKAYQEVHRLVSIISRQVSGGFVDHPQHSWTEEMLPLANGIPPEDHTPVINNDDLSNLSLDELLELATRKVRDLPTPPATPEMPPTSQPLEPHLRESARPPKEKSLGSLWRDMFSYLWAPKD